MALTVTRWRADLDGHGQQAGDPWQASGVRLRGRAAHARLGWKHERLVAVASDDVAVVRLGERAGPSAFEKRMP